MRPLATRMETPTQIHVRACTRAHVHTQHTVPALTLGMCAQAHVSNLSPGTDTSGERPDPLGSFSAIDFSSLKAGGGLNAVGGKEDSPGSWESWTKAGQWDWEGHRRQ